MSTEEILNLPMADNDAGATTVKGYLIALLAALWTDVEGFSGKRPFGNSGWQYELYGPLVDAGVIRGVKDEEGYLDDVDADAGDKVVAGLIAAL